MHIIPAPDIGDILNVTSITSGAHVNFCSFRVNYLGVGIFLIILIEVNRVNFEKISTSE